jgi:predicted nucleic-acid-binding protein
VSKQRLVDTNLIVRYLVQDHDKHARAAGKLFDACDRGDVVIVVLPVVLAECVFVLESFYGHPRAAIASALGGLISSPGVEIGEATVHLDALSRYKGTKAHFVDCLIAATAVAKSVPISTFDQDFRKFGDVRHRHAHPARRRSATARSHADQFRLVSGWQTVGLQSRWPKP